MGMLSIDGDVAHGSCRSIPGFDMLAGLDTTRSALGYIFHHLAHDAKAASRFGVGEFIDDCMNLGSINLVGGQGNVRFYADKS